MQARACAALLAWLAASCAEGLPRGPTTAQPMPGSNETQRGAADALGRALLGALQQADVERVLVADDTLRVLLEADAATRFSARRAGLGVRLGASDRVAADLTGASYLGVCLVDAADQPRHGPEGLRAPGWVVRRVLLAARRPDGGRVGLWVEGLFLWTDGGFFALELERVEAPRWEHSDLELTACDVATSLR